eukprot:scaffold1044_cov266-Pinguiococcus_pyrenoidosus.AAC.7
MVGGRRAGWRCAARDGISLSNLDSRHDRPSSGSRCMLKEGTEFLKFTNSAETTMGVHLQGRSLKAPFSDAEDCFLTASPKACSRRSRIPHGLAFWRSSPEFLPCTRIPQTSGVACIKPPAEGTGIVPSSWQPDAHE